MTERFLPGSTAYTKDGRAYTVDEAEDGVVYCTLPNGAETDFPESALFNEKEWASRSGSQDDVLYGRIKRNPTYAAPSASLDRTAAKKIIARSDQLAPGVIDFVAYEIASRSVEASGHSDQREGLSIVKSRAVFDSHPAEIQVSALARVLGAEPSVLISVADLGENILKAIIDKGVALHHDAFEDFCDRPRR